MLPFNVEIFDRQTMQFIGHDTVGEFEFEDDYLVPQQSRVVIRDLGLEPKNQFIQIRGNGISYVGVISDISDNPQYGTQEIQFGSFIYSLLNLDVLIDTSQQGVGSLESFLKGMIDALFVNNTDSSQNISGLTTVAATSTTGWGFNLKSETAGQHHLIANMYSSLIVRSLSKYSVAINPEFNFTAKTITLRIGRVDDVTNIEADLPSVISSRVVFQQANNLLNKLVVFNQADYSQHVDYYLHPGGSYSTSATDRILPVVLRMTSTAAEEGQTFAAAAQQTASEIFGQITYENLIEVSVMDVDSLFSPLSMQIGQVVNVYSNGTAYASVYSGRKSSKGIWTLIFGTIRLDLTRRLWRALKK